MFFMAKNYLPSIEAPATSPADNSKLINCSWPPNATTASEKTPTLKTK
jgi:hypothetical protein